MYHYTLPLESPAGHALSSISARMMEARIAATSLMRKLGAEQYVGDGRFSSGGISELAFREQQNLKAWKYTGKNGSYFHYSPRRNKKAGYDIQQLIDALPCVKGSEVNRCIGLDVLDRIPGWFLYATNYHIRSFYALTLTDVVPISEERYFAAREEFEQQRKEQTLNQED